MSFISYLNSNSGALNAIFSFIVAISTVVYAYLTHNLVSETKKMREFQLNPEMIVTVEPKEGYMQYMYLIIQNIGGGAALDINFEVNPDFEYYESKFLSDVGIIKKGLNLLAPGQKISFLLTDLPYLIEEDKFTSFEIKVTYQSSSDEKCERTYSIDLSQFRGVAFMPNHHLIPTLESIQKELSKIEGKM